MITILTDIDHLDLNGDHDVRSFSAGEIHELSDANEKRLIELGVAEPTDAAAPEPLQAIPPAPATATDGMAEADEQTGTITPRDLAPGEMLEDGSSSEALAAIQDRFNALPDEQKTQLAEIAGNLADPTE